MERISLQEAGVEAAAAKAAAALRAGGLVLYPTDTLYGLGADAFSDAAVANLFALKGRPDGKPVHAIVADLDMAARYGEVNDMARSLLENTPKGKVSLVVRKHAQLDTGIAHSIETFGFRIPDSALCAALTRTFNAPITATSANVSGLAPLRSVDDILAQFGASADGIALVIDAGELAPSAPSTVVDCTGVTPVVLREGAVLTTKIMESARV